MKRRKSLVQDERGSVAVGGIFMAAFLAGAVFYSSSMSHTAIQREGMQQTADAAVFSEAVLSSRGMNMISSMNVIMVALNAVQLPVRAMKPAYQQVIPTVTPPCNLGDRCSCQILQDAQRALQQIGQIEQQTETRIGQIHQSLSDAQDAIAKTTPQLGQRAAQNAGSANPEFLAQTPQIYSSSLQAQGCRKGLPVEDDDFRNVCTRAKKYTPELAMRLADPTLQTMQGSCKSGPMAMGFAQPTFPQVDQMYCTEAQQPPCGGGPHPKKIVQNGKNGSDHMQFWTKLGGQEMKEAKHAIDNMQDKQPRKENAAFNIAFAQSEVYFDTTQKWQQANQPSQEQKEQTMYDTRWTARLRRVNVPQISFAGSGEVQQFADPNKWNQARKQLFTERRQFWGTPPRTAVANLLMSSQEGPLQ